MRKFLLRNDLSKFSNSLGLTLCRLNQQKMSKTIFNFQNTYATLSPVFYEALNLNNEFNAELVLWNEQLANALDLTIDDETFLTKVLSGQTLDANSKPIAQAYAGHQFGHFTMLGDGRTALLGEHLTNANQRVDVQLKGSGPTQFSRNGDGKSTFAAVLREYLFSESLHYLNIPTSRSLAVVRTSEQIERKELETAGILTRVMSSHLRVGTFELAGAVSTEYLHELLDYTVNRHFKELNNVENKALAFLEKVMNLQMNLVLNWLRVGFIHGVMNTDNTSIVGETFDFGPCAFIGNYDPGAVFSSIDHQGRYAFGQQKSIIQWNMARLAESLLPLIDPKPSKAVALAQTLLNEYAQQFEMNWYEMFGLKLGITNFTEDDRSLVDGFLELIHQNKKDFNHSFTYLRLPDLYENFAFDLGENFDDWKKAWEIRLSQNRPQAFLTMEKMNPIYVLKNHYIEKAILEANRGDFSLFNELLAQLKTPYTFKKEMSSTFFGPANFDENYQTFCGT